MRTNAYGQVEQTFTSLPFGDEFSPGGQQTEAPRFGMLDRDSESDTEHAQYRQYSSRFGRWMSPDPYSGSYDFSNPQSLNRYSYVNNLPFSATDPSGLFGEDVFLRVFVHCGAACASNPIGLIAASVTMGVGAVAVLGRVLGLWGKPAFQGSLKPRPTSASCSVSADSLDQYLAKKQSPLAGEGKNLIDVGSKYDVDPRLLVSLAGAETGFGQNITRGNYNAWNWLWNRKDPSHSDFTSWLNGETSVAHHLPMSYDMASTKTLYTKYCNGSDCANGLKNLNAFMKEQGGNSESLRNPCGKQPE